MGHHLKFGQVDGFLHNGVHMSLTLTQRDVLRSLLPSPDPVELFTIDNRHVLDALNALVEDMTTVILGYQKDAIIVSRDIVQRKHLPAVGQNKLNEVCYGLIKSLYLKS